MDGSSPLFWIILLVLVGAGMEMASSHSVYRVEHISDVFSLPLPVRVELVGEISSPHFSGGALVFDLENKGRITCYYRHPPSLLSVFAGDEYVVRGRIEPTPRGRLCVVEELVAHVVG